MTDKMLKFVEIGQQTPPKREIDTRKEDFKEIYDEFINQKAQEQSSRCSQCGVPFCQVHCPLSNNIPDWLKLTAEGRLKEAYELSQSTNNMPEVCGRICPQDRLCEGNCVIEQSGHGTVTIGSMEKYITDNAWEQGWIKPITFACKNCLFNLIRIFSNDGSISLNFLNLFLYLSSPTILFPK